MSENQTISYPYLIRRAITVSIEIVIILILLFFLPDLISLILNLYGF
jgi:hypothetical protein